MNIAKFLEAGAYEFERVPHRATYSAQRLAQERHVPGREVAKTVLLRVDGGYKHIVAVLPASKSIDLTKRRNCWVDQNSNSPLSSTWKSIARIANLACFRRLVHGME